MNIKAITKLMIDAGIEQNEARIEVKMLLEHFCKYTEMDKLKGIELTPEQLLLIEDKVRERIATGKPIQYIIGESYFMGEYFKVSPSVLIPRDETEILVRKAIEIIQKNNFKSILDIGTGSGCIACTIAKRTEAVVLGVDISSDALRIALDNVTKLGINNKAVFRKSDLFSKIRDDEQFDLIVSNPPYIPNGTKLDKELEYEPEIALFGGADGLDIYRRIIKESYYYLNSKGYLLFELGIQESEKVKELMQENFEKIEIIKDLAGIDRVICGKLKK